MDATQSGKTVVGCHPSYWIAVLNDHHFGTGSHEVGVTIWVEQFQLCDLLCKWPIHSSITLQLHPKNIPKLIVVAKLNCPPYKRTTAALWQYVLKSGLKGTSHATPFCKILKLSKHEKLLPFPQSRFAPESDPLNSQKD